MPRPSVCVFGSLATTLVTFTFAAAQNVISVRPGTISYVEGQASVANATNGASLNDSSAGATSLRAGETLETTRGRVEVVLTPSVFLRVGQNSAVTMISPSLIHTVVQVKRGRAEIEVDQLFEQNDLRVQMGDGPAATETQLEKAGLYEFDADSGVVRVFYGRAEVGRGGVAGKPITVKGGHELALAAEAAKAQGFKRKDAADELTRWSDLRSNYAEQENAGLAGQGGGYGAYGSGFGSYGSGYSGFGGYGLGFAGIGGYPWFGGGFGGPFGFGFGSPLLYGGGFGYPGYGFAGGYPGYGFGSGYGYGFGGYGGGYGYGGSGYATSRSGSGPYLHRGVSGQLDNRGTGTPARAGGNSVPLHSGAWTTSGRVAPSGGQGGLHNSGGNGGGYSGSGHQASGATASGGGFHGGGGGSAGGGSHSSGGGGGGHR